MFQLATAIHVTPNRQLTNYLQPIKLLEFDADETPLMQLIKILQYKDLHVRRLFDRLFHAQQLQRPCCTFSRSGLLVSPDLARMTDSLLEMLVFLKCNSCLI